jgi:peptidoglycan/LPS O-acetylase OafA/YrhL
MFILSESPPNIKIYFANLTMLNDYLNIQDVDGVYWTLHAELKFYFLIFLLVWTKIINKPYLYLPIWLFLTYVYYFTNQPFFMGWIISPFYSSFFISGISLYLLFKGQGGILNISVLVLAIIMSIFQTWDQGMGFIPHLSYVDKIVSCIIVFIFFIIFIIIVKKPPIENRVTIFKNLSDLTYPIYLIHASVGKHIFDILFIKYSFNKLLSLIVTIIFILIISALINRFIGVPASGKLTNLMERISGAK